MSATAPDVKEAYKRFLDTEPPVGGYHTQGPAGLCKMVARQFLRDQSRWNEFLPLIYRDTRGNNPKVVSRSAGGSKAYWPRRFDRQPITS